MSLYQTQLLGSCQLLPNTESVQSFVASVVEALPTPRDWAVFFALHPNETTSLFLLTPNADSPSYDSVKVTSFTDGWYYAMQYFGKELPELKEILFRSPSVINAFDVLFGQASSADVLNIREENLDMFQFPPVQKAIAFTTCRLIA